MSGDVWTQLLSVALVGTDRYQSALPTLAPPLDTLPVSGVLEAAGAVTVARRAGVLPHRQATPDPAPPDTRPVMPPIAARWLAQLLSPECKDAVWIRTFTLIQETLTLASRRGYRVPPSLLPALLDLATRKQHLRPLVGAVGGERARWLASQRAEWGWLLKQETDILAEAVWRDGPLPERVAYLKALRRRDPAAARERLMKAWSAEHPAHRAALLSALAVNLGPEDEELCERALDSRLWKLRTQAAALLALLPGSAYRERMTARALACVRRDAVGQIVVTPPTTCDQDMIRDGVLPEPPDRSSKPVWWLRQVVAHTPLAAWETLDPDPSSLLRRERYGSGAEVLEAGWAEAIDRQNDSVWASAFFDYWISQGRTFAPPEAPVQLLRLVPQDQLVEYAAANFKGGSSQIIAVLEHCPTPWPAKLAEAALTALGAAAISWNTLPYVAMGLDPALADEAKRRLDATTAIRPDGPVSAIYRNVVTTLSIRFQIHKELA